MFLIAGITPRVKTLDQNPRRCPVCGLNQAYYRRVDHWLNLFFIPVIRIKKGEPFIMCDRCERSLPGFEPQFKTRQESPHRPGTCRFCHRLLQEDFKFCPYCGRRI